MNQFIHSAKPVIDTDKPYVEIDEPVAPGAEVPESFYAFYSGCLVTEPGSARITEDKGNLSPSPIDRK